MSALVDARALGAELGAEPGAEPGDGAPLLLDVRWSLAGAEPNGYVAGHLPGAVFCDLDADLAGRPGAGGRHPLPTEESLTISMRRLGVGPGRRVVVYDGGAGMAAARAWWCLRWAGHADVRVLDGGLPAWTASGGSLQQGDVEPVPAPDARARVGAMPVVSTRDVAAGAAGVLVDVRSSERFRGEVEPVDAVAGHVPGALSCPATRLLDDDGRYLPPSRLRAVLAPVLDAADGASGIAASCGSGVTACQLVLALHEIDVDAALYPGSWSEWIRDPSRPVAVGE